jgi:selT/selW/selH-like putative selenoprotein
VEAKLIKSGGGVFEVVADGKLIFSKKKENRFPEHSEILGKLK